MSTKRGKRKAAGTRKAGAIGNASLARHDCGENEDAPISPILPQHQQQVEAIEEIIRGLKIKVENKCDYIMSEKVSSTDALSRARARAKSSIPKQHRHMKLAQYCADFGDNYETILFDALAPKEREALLAQANEESDDDDDDCDGNNPGTTIKGRQPLAVIVPQTPSGRSKLPRGRATRSAIKTKGGDSGATEARQDRGAVPQTPSGRGALPPAGRVTRSAIKAKANGGSSTSPVPPPRQHELGLPASIVAELHKRAKPNQTVYEHLDAIIQLRLDDVPRKAAERCDQLRRKFEEGSATLRATIPNNTLALASSGKGKDNCGKKLWTDGAKEGEGLDVEEAGETAKVSVSAEGGPYNGFIFELSLEKGGKACMVGRSSGKKFKQKGISLSKDSEVSIFHGKFENSDGRVTFTDIGSTNGTEVDEKPADQGTAYSMVTGSKLRIGQSILTLAIRWK